MEEKEIKILLEENQYNNALEIFKWNKEIIQINHYYTSALTQEKKVTVRVRQIGDKYYLQIKAPLSRKKSLHISAESEKELMHLPKSISGEELEKLCGIELGDCKYVGELKTVRKVCNYDDNTEICLDENFYLGKTDYEIEVEYTGEQNGALISMIETRISPRSKKTQGKVSRFMSEYKTSST